ncbi:MAG TPA: hypothetical protein VM409_07385 [Chloroflexia bacterium]|nr:hypothetical protein [Chloroflexia bacterium]
MHPSRIVLGIAPALFDLIFMHIVLAGITQCHLGLPPVDTLSRSVPIRILVTADVRWTVREPAPFAASIERVGAIVPAAQTFLIVAALGFFAPLYLGCLSRLFPQLSLVGCPAQAANRGFNVAMLSTEVAATDYTLGRRGAETY